MEVQMLSHHNMKSTSGRQHRGIAYKVFSSRIALNPVTSLFMSGCVSA